MTWEQLKLFCNSLPESELSKDVFLWREEEYVDEILASRLDEDCYAEFERIEDGCMYESTAKNIIKDNKADYPEGMKHFFIVYSKGTPVLFEDF